MSERERLNQKGFKFTDTTIDYTGTILSADFGSGYKRTAVVGLPLREWSITIEALPNSSDYMVDAGAHGQQTRAAYLWDFYCRRLDAGNEEFWIRVFDPNTDTERDYLVEFVELRLTYKVFTRTLFATGQVLRQRRVRGVEGTGAPTFEQNPSEI